VPVFLDPGDERAAPRVRSPAGTAMRGLGRSPRPLSSA
jgi:hypothetical protein